MINMTYEYKCTNENCNHEWTQEQRISEDSLKYCPKCQQETAKRLISNSGGFILKGSGWFKDGY